jgi:hypothetical protein
MKKYERNKKEKILKAASKKKKGECKGSDGWYPKHDWGPIYNGFPRHTFGKSILVTHENLEEIEKEAISLLLFYRECKRCGTYEWVPKEKVKEYL